jgi:hypothetical protein
MPVGSGFNHPDRRTAVSIGIFAPLHPFDLLLRQHLNLPVVGDHPIWLLKSAPVSDATGSVEARPRAACD